MKKIIAVLGLLAFALPARAQVTNEDTIILAARYDLDAAAYTYCATTGINGTTSDRNREAPQGANRIDVAANSTTATSDGSLGSFANVAVNDVLFINFRGQTVYRVVTARASANSITLHAVLSTTLAAVDAPFTFRKLLCGTTDTSGAFPTTGVRSLTIQVGLAQENSASTDYKIECRLHGPSMAWSVINGPNNDTTTFNDIFSTEVAYDECRVGAQVNTDDGDDLTTNAEQLTIIAKRVR